MIRSSFKKVFCLAIITAMLSAFALCIGGCSRRISCGSEASNEAGISMKVTGCKVEVNKLGSSIFNTELQVTNNGTLELTSVSYEIDVLDRSGRILYTFPGKYVHNESPLIKGETVLFSRGFQRVLDGKPASVSVRITDYTDQTQLKALHIPQKGEYLYLALEKPYLNQICEYPPVAVEIVIDHMGAQETAVVTDEQTIEAIVSAFTAVKIGDESQEFVTDNYNGISFTFADGNSSGISLNLKNLELNLNGEYHIFELDDFGPLWKLMNDLADYE